MVGPSAGRSADPSDAIRAVLFADSRVQAVELTGSRARGTATELSDWDYRVVSDAPAAVARQLPSLTAALQPLGHLWDPLASTPVYMMVLPGAVKADLFPGAAARPAAECGPADPVSSLRENDAHFWDWNLWLGAKRLRARDDVVTGELAKMWRHLLRPLGAAVPPETQPDAITLYMKLRDQRERQLGCAVARDLGDAVLTRLRSAGLHPAGAP